MLARCLTLVALCCVGLAGCVRAGFVDPAVVCDSGVGSHDTFLPDVLHPDATQIPPNAVFISVTGDDANPGTEAAPWRTWSHALGQLSPGDTLVAMPGVYGAASKTGYLDANCSETATQCAGGPCPNGTATEPITVMAYQERTAFLKAELDTGVAVHIRYCRHWRIIGLRSESIDDPNNSDQGFPVRVGHSEEITLRRMLAGRPNRYGNTKVYEIISSARVLVEECEAYDFHRSGFIVWNSDEVVLRRNYANGRLRANVPGGYITACGDMTPTNSTGFSFGGADKSIAENNVAENVCTGFSVSMAGGKGDGNILVDNMVLGTFYYGFFMSSSCDSQDPCVDEARIVRDNVFSDNVALGGRLSRYFRGAVGTTLSHGTALGYQDSGFVFDLSPQNEGLAGTMQVTGSLAVSTGAGRGFSVAEQQSWSVSYSNAHGNTDDYVPATAEPSNGSYDPLLGGCVVYIPQGSPGKGTAKAGSDVGANIILRSENGALSGTKLWDPVTGSFPCGAVVSGQNDAATFPDSACINVHGRLHVGSAGCPVP